MNFTQLCEGMFTSWRYRNEFECVCRTHSNGIYKITLQYPILTDGGTGVASDTLYEGTDVIAAENAWNEAFKGW